VKIINNNVLHNGTYSATSESLNYPVSNLDHPFLSKRFQATANTSNVTIDLADKSNINSIAYGLTNVTSGSVKLYTESGGSYTLVETVTMVFDYYSNVIYTTALRADIARVVFELTTTDSYVRLGGISAGEAFEIDYAFSDFERPYSDASTWQQTAGGQSLVNYRKPLKSISLTFNAESLSDANSLIEVYEESGIGAPFFVDFFSGKRALVNPLYCCFSQPPSDRGKGENRTITIEFQECR